MLRLRSARDLALDTRWRFGFVPYDARAVTTPGVIYIDVGGSESGPLPGVLDHHKQQSGFSSSASIAASRPDLVYNHLLSPWLLRADDGRLPPGACWEPLIVTHQHPDWDAAVTASLIRHLIENGTLPDRIRDLVAYTDRVDQGRWTYRPAETKLDDAPHLALRAAAHLYQGDHEKILRIGLGLVDCYLAASPWTLNAAFAPLRDFLAEQYEAHRRDRANADLVAEFPVPAADAGPPLKVPAFLLREPSQCALNKDFVRGEGYPLFFCPYDVKGKSVVVISLNPDWEQEGRRPSLQGLGLVLEQAEAAARKEKYGHDDRPGPPRWSDGSCTNRDPWYDGRGHNFTLVQTPDSGTVLPLAEVRAVLEKAEYASTPLACAEIVLLWKDPGYEKWTYDRERKSTVIDLVSTWYSTTPYRCESAEGVLLRHDPFEERDGGYCQPSCPDFFAVTLRASAGQTFESLLDQRDRLIAECMNNKPPRYVLARIAPHPQFVEKTRRLIPRLAHGALRTAPHASSRECLTNSRHVIHTVEPGQTATAEEFEPLLYAAMLRESLDEFTADLAQAGSREASHLRRRFLAFQTEYWRRDAGATPSAQETFRILAAEMDLAARYEEVHAQLERLGEIERESTERKLEELVLVLSAIAVLQTLTSYFALNYKDSDKPLLTALSVAVPSIVILYYFWRIREEIGAKAFGILSAAVLAIALLWVY